MFLSRRNPEKTGARCFHFGNGGPRNVLPAVASRRAAVRGRRGVLPHMRSSRTVLVASYGLSMPHVGSFGAALNLGFARRPEAIAPEAICEESFGLGICGAAFASYDA